MALVKMRLEGHGPEVEAGEVPETSVAYWQSKGYEEVDEVADLASLPKDRLLEEAGNRGVAVPKRASAKEIAEAVAASAAPAEPVQA